MGVDFHATGYRIDRLYPGPGGSSVVIRSAPPVMAILLAGAALSATNGQEVVRSAPEVEIEAEGLPSAYGAPPDLSHARISTLTKSYVLSPFSFEVETGYESDAFRHGLPAHLFTQEIEMGLPARFTIGLHNLVERFDGNTRDPEFTVEGRYALANWNKLPLNPTIAAEYHFGLGSGAEDSGELALLVSHDFPHMIEWALNLSLEQEFSGKERTGAGFAQTIEIPVLLPEEKLEVGVEMQYRSDKTANLERPTKGFVIGPTLAWRPNKTARFDLSPLLGCSDHTPAVQIFAIFSLSFGSGGDTDAPASAHSR
jgi:hypothetical protein